MLRGFLVAPNRDLRSGLQARIADSGQVVLLRTFERYLTDEELHRFGRAHNPHLLFLDIETDPDVLEITQKLPDLLPNTQLVVLHGACTPDLLLKLMNLGLRELLYPPFAKELYLESIGRLDRAVREAPVVNDSSDLLYAFLPAKGGCGSSTLATNVAAALTRATSGGVLLADFDLPSGIVRFLLKIAHAFSIQDALERAGELDERLWAELTATSGKLDVLASGPVQKDFRVEIGAIRRLFEFARRRYKAICADLSGQLEDFSIDVLQESRRVLLVVQPDLPTVYLAREKLRLLQSLELDDRVSIILNRWRRDACLSIADIESVVGLPVEYTVSEDHEAVYKALLSGTPLDPASEAGKEVARLAVMLGEARPEKAVVTPKRRMVEYFSLLPARYSLFPGPR
jgi:pilus assembly protein CpaE